MKIKDIIFWIIIIGLILVALWILHGSPTDSSAIIAIATFTAASEIIIWKSIFSVDKKTAIGFEKIKSQINRIENKLNEINSSLNKKK